MQILKRTIKIKACLLVGGRRAERKSGGTSSGGIIQKRKSIWGCGGYVFRRIIRGLVLERPLIGWAV